MGVNPSTGKFRYHIDTWDAVENNAFFSAEAFAHMLSQVGNLTQEPRGLEQPPYQVLMKKKNYEIRRYEPIMVAETEINGPAAFGALAGYIFGKNERQEKMAMTTPVLSTPQKMQFYLGSRAQVGALPQPQQAGRGGVQVKKQDGGLFAVASIGGVVDERKAAVKAEELKRELKRDGVGVVQGKERGDWWVLARYNDPSTLPPFRKNEVMVELDGDRFKLW